jgi:hypothetical protein
MSSFGITSVEPLDSVARDFLNLEMMSFFSA